MNVIGIDVGGTKILGIRADEEGRVLARVRELTQAEEGLDAVVERIAGIISDLLPPEGLGSVDGIGVGLPGPVNPEKGEVYDPPNLPGWTAVPLRKLLQKHLNLHDTPVALINDANAAAMAEYRFGAGSERTHGKLIRHLVYLTISTGVGGGVIVDGKLLLGSTGMAAELGHIVIDLHGPLCSCGNRGCLEAMASGPAMAREAALLVSSRRKTMLSDAVGGDPEKMTAQIVTEAAQAGDLPALELFAREAEYVGVGVVNCVHSFNPQLVVIGGGVSNAGDLLFKPVRDTVAARIMPAYHGTFEIVPARLGNDVGALGAVAAALDFLGK